MEINPKDIFPLNNGVYVVIKTTEIDGLFMPKVIGVYQNYWDAQNVSISGEYTPGGANGLTPTGSPIALGGANLITDFSS